MMPGYVYLILTGLLCAASAYVAHAETRNRAKDKVIGQLTSDDFIRGATLNQIWKGIFNERTYEFVDRVFSRDRTAGRRRRDRGDEQREEEVSYDRGAGDVAEGKRGEERKHSGRPPHRFDLGLVSGGEGIGGKVSIRTKEAG